MIGMAVCILFGILNLVLAIAFNSNYLGIRLFNAFAAGWCFAFAIAIASRR